MGKALKWLKGLFGIKSKHTTNSVNHKDPKRRCSLVGGQSSRRSTEDDWLTSFHNETEKEQNKHAIAVAAATAAAADAAVAAAQAAVAVVRLTSHRRTCNVVGRKMAAVKIQATFRGYLARKALRALKGLVKLQAVVRGYLVRKQATATLRSMQALIRAQASARSQRLQMRARKSTERFDETRSEHPVSIHSRRLSAPIDTIEGSPKIVEVDTGRPKSRSGRTISEFSDDPFYQTISSPLIPTRFSGRLSIPNIKKLNNPDWDYTGNECRFSTAQSTPRFINFPVNYPNYMSNTKSSKAKLRSHSAPKQRPLEVAAPVVGGTKKRLSLHEMMESRFSLSGVRMQRSCSQVQEAIDVKNA